MEYRRLFDPYQFVEPAPVKALVDRRDGTVYDYDERTVLTVNVALATGRPLLVRGLSGGGKSSLARHVARVQGWRYYERVISSRTQAQDLLWELDHLRRLHDAQARKLRSGLGAYVRPGVLWWAFNRASAARQAKRLRAAEGGVAATDPNQGAAAARAVVLLDEIDKADPDVPNNLLVPLGSLQFEVEDTGEVVKTTEEQAPLVVITTNNERELPDAFLRRCVELELPLSDDPARLARIGRKHFPNESEEDLKDVAVRVFAAAGQVVPSPAEYLDVVRAWQHFRGDSDESGRELDPKIWEEVLRVAVRKPGRAAGGKR